MFSESYVPLGYQQLTSAELAEATLLTIPAGANLAVISVEGAGVRWRDDGTMPTASVGMPIAEGAAPFVYSGTLSAIAFIAQSGSPLVNVSYYRVVG